MGWKLPVRTLGIFTHQRNGKLQVFKNSWFGPTSSIFDVTIFILMFFFVAPQLAGGNYHTLGGEQQEAFITIFQSGWSIVSLWTQTHVL